MVTKGRRKNSRDDDSADSSSSKDDHSTRNDEENVSVSNEELEDGNGSSSDDGKNSDDDHSSTAEKPKSSKKQQSDDADESTEDVNEEDEDTPKKKPKKIRKLKLSATQDFNAKLQKRGILYLARVPPRMGPAKVKQLLADFGTVTRVYLVEEDKTARKRRRKAGGSGGKRHTEGWVEFESKKVAKRVGETLNMTRVTNHKRSVHYDDLWNVKYLKGFKWSHLTEKVAYERRVREQKLRVEMMEVKRENASYIAQVEAGKRLDYIENRRNKRTAKEGGGKVGNTEDAGMANKKRRVRQKKPFEGDSARSAKSAILGSLV